MTNGGYLNHYYQLNSAHHSLLSLVCTNSAETMVMPDGSIQLDQ